MVLDVHFLVSHFCIGLTGGLASGKTTVANLFAEQGVVVVDADEIAAELTAADGAALPALRTALGDWAFCEDGALHRAAVRRRVFDEPTLRRRLESVLHPLIQRAMRTRLRAADSPYALGVVPLLAESGGDWRDFFQRILVVHCDAEQQRQRAAARDGVDDAAAIMATQMSAEERLHYADDIIDNNGSPERLSAAVLARHQHYRRLAAEALAPAN